MDLGFFEQVGEVARLSLDVDVHQLHQRSHRSGVKVWFGEEKTAREHYEAQLVSRNHFDGGKGVVLEIGFHAEHRNPSQNQGLVTRLLSMADQWEDVLGEVLDRPDDLRHDVVTAGDFLGNDTWCRVSETWPDPDLEDTELSFEAGVRLAEYVNALQPVLDSLSDQD